MKNLKEKPTLRDLRFAVNVFNDLDSIYEDFFSININSNEITYLGHYADGVVGKYEDLGFKFEKTTEQNSTSKVEFYKGIAYYEDIKIDVSFARTLKNE